MATQIVMCPKCGGKGERVPDSPKWRCKECGYRGDWFTFKAMVVKEAGEARDAASTTVPWPWEIHGSAVQDRRTGSRMIFGSQEAAIQWVKETCRLPVNKEIGPVVQSAGNPLLGEVKAVKVSCPRCGKERQLSADAILWVCSQCDCAVPVFEELTVDVADTVAKKEKAEKWAKSAMTERARRESQTKLVEKGERPMNKMAKKAVRLYQSWGLLCMVTMTGWVVVKVWPYCETLVEWLTPVVMRGMKPVYDWVGGSADRYSSPRAWMLLGACGLLGIVCLGVLVGLRRLHDRLMATRTTK